LIILFLVSTIFSRSFAIVLLISATSRQSDEEISACFSHPSYLILPGCSLFAAEYAVLAFWPYFRHSWRLKSLAYLAYRFFEKFDFLFYSSRPRFFLSAILAVRQLVLHTTGGQCPATTGRRARPHRGRRVGGESLAEDMIRGHRTWLRPRGAITPRCAPSEVRCARRGGPRPTGCRRRRRQWTGRTVARMQGRGGVGARPSRASPQLSEGTAHSPGLSRD